MNASLRVSGVIAIIFVGLGSALMAVEMPNEKKLVIGRIEDSPKGMPLQFHLTTQEGKRLLQCSQETKVTRGKEKSNRDALRKGQYVVTSGTVSGELFLASEIKLVDAIEGKIDAVMAIFPPQLSVRTKKGTVSVQLSKETRVFRGKAAIDSGKLNADDTVRVVGLLANEQMDAEEIVILPKSDP